MDLIAELKKTISGDVDASEEARLSASRDASIFEIKPRVVVHPKNVSDIKKLIAFVASQKPKHPDLSLTARAAGTDMGGGPLSSSIIVSFNKISEQDHRRFT
jgi:FAD/FMN-containing dehydrogenases